MRSRKPLDIYLSYFRERGGTYDLLSVFRQVRERFGCKHVLYPGSYLHVTPSLVFPRVCYIDSLRNICRSLSNPGLLQYIHSHKEYPEDAEVECYEEDYSTFKSEPEASFDLLLSLNAGFISQACKRFLKPGGLLLVNDTHYDASRAYVDSDYQLLGVFEGEGQLLETSEQELGAYFQPIKGESLTLEMVEANAPRSPSKAPFKLAKQAAGYLFQRRKTSASRTL